VDQVKYCITIKIFFNEIWYIALYPSVRPSSSYGWLKYHVLANISSHHMHFHNNLFLVSISNNHVNGRIRCSILIMSSMQSSLFLLRLQAKDGRSKSKHFLFFNLKDFVSKVGVPAYKILKDKKILLRPRLHGGAFLLTVFGGSGFCHVSMRTTVLDDGVAIWLCSISVP